MKGSVGMRGIDITIHQYIIKQREGKRSEIETTRHRDNEAERTESRREREKMRKIRKENVNTPGEAFTRSGDV